MRPRVSRAGKGMARGATRTLPERLVLLLEWLVAKPFLNGRQLPVACRYAGIGYPRETLAALERQGLATHLVGPGRPDVPLHRYYRITRQGIKALASHQGVTFRSVARRYWLSPRRLAFLVRALGHTEACHQFFVELVLDGERTGAAAVGEGLALWQGEAEAYRRYPLDGLMRALRPDAFGVYRWGGREVSFFLEWDSGNMAAARHRRKLLAYHDYRVWWQAQEDGQSFPAILVATPSQGRADLLNRLVLELARAARTPALPVLITTHQALAAARPVGADWWDAARQEVLNPFKLEAVAMKEVSRWK